MPFKLIWLSKIIDVAYIYKAVSDTISELFEDDEEEVKKPATKTSRKTRDTTKYTQYMYDFIIESYATFQKLNANKEPGTRNMTRTDLAYKINKRMGTDKSVASLSLIWRDKVDRDTLPVGTKYFEYI